VCRALYAEIPRRNMVAASAGCCDASSEKAARPEADPNGSVSESARSQQKHGKKGSGNGPSRLEDYLFE